MRKYHTKLYLFVCLSKPEMLVDLLAINCNHRTVNLAFAWEATLHYNARLVLLFPFCQKHLEEKETHGLECTTNAFSFVQGDINTHTHPCKCFGICFPGTRICVDNSWLCTLAGGSISNRGALQNLSGTSRWFLQEEQPLRVWFMFLWFCILVDILYMI